MTKLRLLAAFLILVATGAAQAAEKSAASPGQTAPALASQTAATTPTAPTLRSEIPAPFFAAATSCYVEKECCDGTVVFCTGTTCRVGPNKVVCDNIPHFCPICPW